MPGPAVFRTLRRTTRDFVGDPRQGMRELPGRALRVGVIGAGQALLLADRFREEYKEVRREGVGSTVTRLRTEGLSALGRGSARPDHARPDPGQPDLARPDAGTDAQHADAARVDTPPPAPQPREQAPREPEPDAGGPAATSPAAAADLPVPNYDDLTVASLRARLRNLTVEQVEQLCDYEKAHANRDSVVTMYTNRIAKLTDERRDG